MAGKKPTTSQNTAGVVGNPIDWCNIKLSPEDEPEIIELAADKHQCAGELLALCDRGFNISIKARDNNKSIGVTIIGANSRDLSRNVGLTGFAPDVWTACACVLFKYHNLAGTVLEDHLSNSSSAIG